LRPAQNFDTRDVAGQQMREIERAIGCAGVADIDAVDQNLRVIGICAAREDGRDAPGPPVCTTLSPGTSRRTSGRVRNCRRSISSAVMTVTLLAISAAGVGLRVALTTMPESCEMGGDCAKAADARTTGSADAMRPTIGKRRTDTGKPRGNVTRHHEPKFRRLP
jgi:hypothetical protein